MTAHLSGRQAVCCGLGTKGLGKGLVGGEGDMREGGVSYQFQALSTLRLSAELNLTVTGWHSHRGVSRAGRMKSGHSLTSASVLRARKEKKRKEKQRKEKKRKDYTFRRQFNEKPGNIPGCPELRATKQLEQCCHVGQTLHKQDFTRCV